MYYNKYPFYHKPPFKKLCNIKDKVIIKQPIVLFPGCNDNCFGVAHVEENLIKHSHHKIICLEYAHQMQTIVTNLQQLITYACKVLEESKQDLQNGFYAVGLSMGGLIARGVLQQCDIGKNLKRIVAIGTPHLGVMKLPSRDDSFAEKILNQLTRSFIYLKPIQRFISGANMFRDLDRYDQYIDSGSPLIELNNEKEFKKQYKERMESLELFINISFSREEYLVPKETAKWGYFKKSGSDEILTFQETDIYKKDLLGLQKLYKDNKLLFEEVHGKHQDAKVRFNDCWAKILYYFYQLIIIYKFRSNLHLSAYLIIFLFVLIYLLCREYYKKSKPKIQKVFQRKLQGEMIIKKQIYFNSNVLQIYKKRIGIFNNKITQQKSYNNKINIYQIYTYLIVKFIKIKMKKINKLIIYFNNTILLLIYKIFQTITKQILFYKETIQKQNYYIYILETLKEVNHYILDLLQKIWEKVINYK